MAGLSMSGMVSNMDTAAAIEQMLSNYTTKITRTQKNISWLNWQQIAYKDTASSLKIFQDTYFNNTKMETNFMSKTMFKKFNSKVTIDGVESNAATVTTKAGAAPSSYSIKVNALAKADKYLSSGDVTLTDGTTATSSSKLSDLGITTTPVNDTVSSISVGGKTVDINYTQGSYTIDGGETKKLTISKENGKDIVNIDMGDSETTLSINYTDKKYGTYTQTALEAAKGSSNSLTVTDDGTKKTTTFDIGGKTVDVNMTDGTYRVYDIGAAEDKKGKYSKLSGLKDGKATITVGTDTIDLNGLNGTTPSYKAYDINDINAIKTTRNDTLTTSTQAPDTPKEITSFTINDMTFEIDIANGSYRKYKTGAEEINKGEYKQLGTGAGDITIKNIADMVNTSDAGVTMSFNSLSGKLSLESKTEGVDGQIKNLTGDILDKFKLLDSGSHAVTGSDASIEVDGKVITKPTNEIDTGDGVVIKINKAAEGKTIDVEVTSDVDGLVDNVKKFVEEYNKIIKSLNTQTSERRAKTTDKKYFEPLTDEERKNMTENEIKTWEAKAKTGLMYRDSTLQTISSSLRDFLYDPVDIGDGKTLSLYQIGITTSKDVKTESGQLVIDEEKLRKMIEENPDAIANLFSNKDETDSKKNGIAVKMSAAIDAAISTRGSYGSLILKAGGENVNLDQNFMYKQIKEENESLAKLIDSMENKRVSYQKMFTRMELAMSKANSQSAWLAQKA